MKKLVFKLSIDVTNMTQDEIVAKATTIQSVLSQRTKDLSLKYEGDTVENSGIDYSDYDDRPCNPWAGRTDDTN